jgi:hypothetical protein
MNALHYSHKKLTGMILIAMFFSLGFSIMPVTAQSPEDLDTYGASLNESDIDLSINPENPKAFEDVRLFVSSNLIDLNKQKISWFVNGVLTVSNFGARELIITAGNVGSTKTVQVVIEAEGKTLRKIAVVAPSDIVLLWEAIDSYVPPFYQGKKLAGRESMIRITVNPYQQFGGTGARPENGVYVWSRNRNPVSASSGYGKNSFTFKHNRIRGNEAVSVNVSDLQNSVGGNSSIIVPISDPFIVFYEKNPATGIINRNARPSIIMTESEKIIVAEPYFFSVLQNNPASLGIRWTMNNRSIENISHQLLIKNPGSSGNSQIGVRFENPVQTLQSATRAINVLFQQR